MKIELTETQVNAILTLVRKEYDLTNKAFYLGLDHNITKQFEKISDNDKNLLPEMTSILRECYGYFSAPNFTDRYGTGKRIANLLQQLKN